MAIQVVPRISPIPYQGGVVWFDIYSSTGTLNTYRVYPLDGQSAILYQLEDSFAINFTANSDSTFRSIEITGYGFVNGTQENWSVYVKQYGKGTTDDFKITPAVTNKAYNSNTAISFTASGTNAATCTSIYLDGLTYSQTDDLHFTLRDSVTNNTNSDKLYHPIFEIEDSNGDKYQRAVTIIKANHYAYISNPIQTINYNDTSVTYHIVTSETLNSPTVTFLDVDNYLDVQTTATSTGYDLTITIPQNSSTLPRDFDIKIEDVWNDDDGVMYAHLTQNGAGSITLTPSSRTVSANAGSTTFTITTEGIVGSLSTASSAGGMNIGTMTISGDTLTVNYSANSGTSDLNETIYVSGTDTSGNTITGSATITQSGTEVLQPTITATPKYITLSATESTAEYSISLTNINLSQLSASFSDPSWIVSHTFANDKLSVVTQDNYTTVQLSNTITISGTNSSGVYTSTTVNLNKNGITQPYLVINDDTKTIGATEQTATFYCETNNLTGSLTASFNGDVSVASHSFVAVSGGYNLVVVTSDNTTYSTQTTTITVSGTGLDGKTYDDVATLTKLGKGGSIGISPATKTVGAAAGSTNFSVGYTMIDKTTVTASVSGGMNITGTNFDSTKETLTIVYGANTGSINKTGTITVTGTDTNGNQVTATATITQSSGNPSISLSPSSKTVDSASGTTAFTLSYTDIDASTLSTTVSGAITSATINNTTVTVNYSANSSTSSRNGSVTVSATGLNGSTVSDTATIVQSGTASESGSITVNPSVQYVSADPGSFTFEVSYSNMNMDTVTQEYYSGSMEFASFFSGEKDQIRVDYQGNGYTTSIDGVILISGQDNNGDTITQTATLIQSAGEPEPVVGSITITPTSKTVAAVGGSTIYSVALTNMNANSLSVSYNGKITGSSFDTNKTSLLIAYSDNTSSNPVTSTFTITGTDTGGVTRTASATLVQSASASEYSFRFDPTTQTAKTIGSQATTVNYTIISTYGSEAVGYSITNVAYTGNWSTQITIASSNSVLVPLNQDTSSRTATITFTQTGSGNTLTSIITQIASAAVEGISPIWKEVTLTDSSDSFIEYHINSDGNIVYAGKAYAYPGNSIVSWEINDVCSNFLGNGISFTDGIQEIPNYSKIFYIETNNNTNYQETLYNSWAYEDTDYWLSDPIDYRVDPRQWLPVSFLSTNANTITVGGNTYTATQINDGWTVMTDLSSLAFDCNGAIEVSGNGESRSYRFDCGDFVLYYSNAFGGWDSLLLKGTAKKTDDINSLTYRKKAPRTDFSKVKYLNTITPSWSLNTGLYINGQKMYHLLESTMVYLHNLKTNEIIPVVVTNSNCEYLNYKNNGKRPYFYTITVEESHQKIRK